MWMSKKLNNIITTHHNMPPLEMKIKSSHVLYSYIDSYPELWNSQMRATRAVRQTPVSAYSGFMRFVTLSHTIRLKRKPTQQENKQTHQGKYVSNWKKSFWWYTVCLYFDTRAGGWMFKTLIPKHKCIIQIKLFHTLGSALVYAFSRHFRLR